jgi:ABC-type lipoprotein release transport system permease subunit
MSWLADMGRDLRPALGIGAAAAELPPPQTITVATAAVLLLMARFACWLPARRAAALPPMVALRRE